MTLLPKKCRGAVSIWIPAAVLAGQLAAGPDARAGNTVKAWGAGTIYNSADNNDFGQSIVPAGLTNAVQVAGGWRHSLALKADGTLQGWGDDSVGQTDFPTGSNYMAIACGSLHSVALLTNGTVVATGDDDYYGEDDVPGGLTNVVAVACGWYHTLALRADGTVAAWGAGMAGTPLGSNPNYGQTLVPAGLTNVVAIAAGGYHSLALKADGTVSEWGDETTIPAGLTNGVAIATGAAHNVVLRADGSLAVWGLDTYGQTNLPAGLTNVAAIAAGSWHTLALKSDGTVLAWGAGVGANPNVDYGQSTVPAGLTNVVQIAAGWVHSLALVGGGPPALKAPLSAVGDGTNGFTVALPTANGRVYQLEYVNALTNPVWSAFPLQAGTGGLLWLNDPAPSAPHRFYRVNRW